MKGDSLGDRMKKFENVRRDYLMPRVPTLIRVDGKAFHTYTKQMGFKFPFSQLFHDLMSDTAEGLYNNVQNARLCYHQSDEISILLNDWREFKTEQWFGGNIQKITSVSASVATNAFIYSLLSQGGEIESPKDLPVFDARVWQLPKEEVCNYFLWRQQDAARNSIQMLGRAHYSHNEMEGKNQVDIHNMLHEKGINWNDLETWKRRGSCIRAEGIDEEIPLFNHDRSYINDLL